MTSRFEDVLVFATQRSNLREAVALVIEANREMARENASGEAVIREPITVTA